MGIIHEVFPGFESPPSMQTPQVCSGVLSEQGSLLKESQSGDPMQSLWKINRYIFFINFIIIHMCM